MPDGLLALPALVDSAVRAAFPSDRAHFAATLWLWHTVPVVFWFAVYTTCDACPSVFRRYKIQPV